MSTIKSVVVGTAIGVGIGALAYSGLSLYPLMDLFVAGCIVAFALVLTSVYENGKNYGRTYPEAYGVCDSTFQEAQAIGQATDIRILRQREEYREAQS